MNSGIGTWRSAALTFSFKVANITCQHNDIKCSCNRLTQWHWQHSQRTNVMLRKLWLFSKQIMMQSFRWSSFSTSDFWFFLIHPLGSRIINCDPICLHGTYGPFQYQHGVHTNPMGIVSFDAAVEVNLESSQVRWQSLISPTTNMPVTKLHPDLRLNTQGLLVEIC